MGSHAWSRWTRAFVVVAVIAVRVGVPGPASAANGDTTLLVTNAAGVKPNASIGVGGTALSSDDTELVFTSAATNLDPTDTDGVGDVYVKNLTTGALTLVSTSDTGVKSNGDSLSAAISDDGTIVAFTSAATNLGEGDTDADLDVYVKNLTTGALTLASTSDTGVKAIGTSILQDLSADETWSDAYVKNVVTGNLTLASTTDVGANTLGNVFPDSLSDDGTKVAMNAPFIDGEVDNDGNFDVYVKDLTTGALVVASTTDSGANTVGDAQAGLLSGDGTKIFLRAATLGETGDGDSALDGFVKDLTTGAVTLVPTTAAGVKANLDTQLGPISDDGTVVSFSTTATNLDAYDSDSGVFDTYVKNLTTGALALVSTSDAGAKGNGDSFPAVFTGAGDVVIASRATNLGEGDTDALNDVFLKEVPGAATPVAVGDSYTTLPGTARSVSAPGVLANDSDADSGDTMRAIVGALPAHGTVSVSTNGAFTYTPNGGFTGTDAFTYRATDGSHSSALVTVSVLVNTPPVANAGADQSVGSRKSFTLSGTGTDADGDALAYAWQQISGPVAVLRDPDQATTMVDGVPGPATLVFRLTVTDANGAVHADDITVTVRPK
jgi:Big-like domain-containing protein/K319-like protein